MSESNNVEKIDKIKVTIRENPALCLIFPMSATPIIFGIAFGLKKKEIWLRVKEG